MLLTSQDKIITKSIYRIITGASQVTASRQLGDLVKKKVLKVVPEHKGRSATYELRM